MCSDLALYHYQHMSLTQFFLNCSILELSVKTIKYIWLNQSRAYMQGACMYIHPTYTHKHQSIHIQTKIQKFILRPKRPPFAYYMAKMSLAEMSVAEISCICVFMQGSRKFSQGWSSFIPWWVQLHTMVDPVSYHGGYSFRPGWVRQFYLWKRHPLEN